MAATSRNVVLGTGVNMMLIPVRFKTNGTSDPATAYGDGVSSVVRSEQGIYKVTLADSISRVLAVLTAQGLATPATSSLSYKIDNESTDDPLEVLIAIDDDDADLAANADNEISCLIVAEMALGYGANIV